MNRFIEAVESSSVPPVAVVIGENLEHDLLLKAVAGADLIEFRADYFETADTDMLSFEANRLSTLKPTLLTIRKTGEGGKWDGSDELRDRVFSRLIGWVDAVDIEMSSDIRESVLEQASNQGAATILSYHDFVGTFPISMRGALEEAWQLGADYYKFATHVEDSEALGELLDFTRANRHRSLITSGMGKLALRSRAGLAIAGSKLMYARRNGGLATASNQPDLDTVLALRDMLYKKTDGLA